MEEKKSAYELRMEMIKLSTEFLQEQFKTNMEASVKYWEAMNQAAIKAGDAVPKMAMYSAPTFDDIMAMANKMNAFVSNLPKAKQ